jgi:adenine-specific DNA-methyltransferase
MARSPKSPKGKAAKQVDALKHEAARRRNIPTAEMESFFRREEDAEPRPPKHYPRARPLAQGQIRTPEEPSRPELTWNGARIAITEAQMQELAETGKLTLSDAQLVWRGKDRQDWTDLVVNVPPLYIQEKIHPKAIIDDLKRRTAQKREAATDAPDLFADFNGLDPEARAEFYQHDQHWSNRMILGDSLQVMASLAERESLKGKVQCIYFDPPYGIKFNSNWQVSTQSRDVKDGKQTDISREPEQVKAFRDTWKDGIHSYLTYLRDRLTAMRDLLSESGSIFVQISDENAHRIRALLDEIFGETQYLGQIAFVKTTGQTDSAVGSTFDYLLWYCRDHDSAKLRRIYEARPPFENPQERYVCVEPSVGEIIDLSVAQKEGRAPIPDGRILKLIDPSSQTGSDEARKPFIFQGQSFKPSGSRGWSTHEEGRERVAKAGYFHIQGKGLWWKSYRDVFPYRARNNLWLDTRTNAFGDERFYVVQTGTKVIQLCMQMVTDPGDLVLDPTCGSGTTAYVAEQWGRRWITIDTSRVALALARTRLMAARYPWYLLADSREGRAKESELTKRPSVDAPVYGDLRQGFVYERGPRIALKSIANNPLIDGAWEKWQTVLEPLRAALNNALGKAYEEWQIPRVLSAGVAASAKEPHAKWWEARIARQKEIDALIAAHAKPEYLYDKPYIDNARIRVAGPFTVESLSPHRVLPASEEELIKDVEAAEGRRSVADADLAGQDFAAIVIDYLKAEGVKQQAKGDRITFESLAAWPGNFIGASGSFVEGENGPERRAAILIGPEYGTVGRQDLVAAAREAVDARFDVLIACAFNFDAHSSELGNLGGLKILKARINPDMHMSDELKNTGRGNMFVVFGEPDVEILDDGGPEIRVKVHGIDVFDPNTGDIRSNDTKGIAAWFIDTDYNEESFFVRHAYFLGANDPYKSLKTALQAEIDADAWATLYSDTSRPFERPESGLIAVKVINHFGDEVMKVFRV